MKTQEIKSIIIKNGDGCDIAAVINDNGRAVCRGDAKIIRNVKSLLESVHFENTIGGGQSDKSDCSK